jgi:uncharacterized membrane protein YfcA
MTFDTLTLAQLALIIVFGYTVLGLTGFGSSVTAMPLLVLFMPLRTAVPLMLVFDLVANVLLGLKNRRFIEKREALRLIPFMVAGMAVGVLALVHAPERTLLVVLGLFILTYSAWSLLVHRKPRTLAPAWAGPFGVVGGLFTALFGTGGPFYTIFLTSRLDDKTVLRATLSGVLFFSAGRRAAAVRAGRAVRRQPAAPVAAGGAHQAGRVARADRGRDEPRVAQYVINGGSGPGIRAHGRMRVPRRTHPRRPPRRCGPRP